MKRRVDWLKEKEKQDLSFLKDHKQQKELYSQPATDYPSSKKKGLSLHVGAVRG